MKPENPVIPQLTVPIFIAIISGLLVGLGLHYASPSSVWIETILVDKLLVAGGDLFLQTIKMVVIPLVFTSLICAVTSISNSRQLARIGLKTIILYLFTTILAVSLALFFANWFQLGVGVLIPSGDSSIFELELPESSSFIARFVPDNIFAAMANGQMLPVLVSALLFGYAIHAAGSAGQRIAALTADFYQVILRLLAIVMYYSPIGIFCLIAKLFAESGLALVGPLLEYGGVMLTVMALHLTIISVLFLQFYAKLNPVQFYRKMSAAILVAFSTASSNAALPVTLECVEKRLGVKKEVAAFSIPLGATVNMDGGAILQGIAVVFIANLFQLDLSLLDYFFIIGTVILATIGTAGVPGAGIVTMALVLNEVGLPIEGIALVVGVDRILEMFRTATNVTGDAIVSCAVAHSEKMLDRDLYNSARPIPSSSKTG